MAAGGLVLEAVPLEERRSAGLEGAGMALRVKYLGGGNGPHAAAKQAGFRQGDVVVAFDGRTDLGRETDLLAYAVNRHQPGDRVAVTVLRDGRRIDLTLPMQE